MNNRWHDVANPISGQGRAMHHRHEIEAVLRRHGIDFDFVISEHPGHAIDLARSAVEGGCRHVLAVGGDGTANECANGIIRQQAAPTEDVILGVMPIGTGNDWARGLGILKDYAEVAALMASGASRLQDVGIATFGDGCVRQFVNVAGLGFDAHVWKPCPTARSGRWPIWPAWRRGCSPTTPCRWD